MKITYEFTAEEKKFVEKLYSKKHNVGQWTGMMCDDDFRKKHEDVIEVFRIQGLTEKKDDGYGYWRYGLNNRGIEAVRQNNGKND